MSHLLKPQLAGFIAALFFCTSFRVAAQDSIIAPSPKKVTIKPAFDFDQRFSFIRHEQVNIWGQRGGILINDKFKAGVGAYFLNDRLRSILTDTVWARRNLYFGTVYYEPFVFRYKFVEFSIPFEMGYGKSVYRTYSTSENILVTSARRNFYPTGAGLSLSFKLPPIGRFKPTRWLGINFLAGYRYCLFQQPQVNYNGAFWSISGAIFLDRFTDDYRQWHQQRMAQKKMYGAEP